MTLRPILFLWHFQVLVLLIGLAGDPACADIAVQFKEEPAAQQSSSLPRLWVFAIGINRYQDHNLSANKYAVADAEAIVGVFQKQQGKLFKEVHTVLITDNSAVPPTRRQILETLTYPKSAGSNELIVVFYAGLGEVDERGRFYLLPTDVVVSEIGTVRTTAIYGNELARNLDGPAHKLLFLDAAFSGSPSNGVLQGLLGANAVVLTSGEGVATESGDLGHGHFTLAVLEGLSGKADANGDKSVSIKELDAYVSRRVPEVSKGRQRPVTYVSGQYVDFPVASVESGVNR
jgi:uncharacterized caspase-like protein